METRVGDAAFGGAPVQFVDVFPLTAGSEDRSVPGSARREAPAGLYGYQPDPATDAYPAGAHLAGEREDDVVDARRAPPARRRAADAPGRCRGARTRDGRSRCASSTSSAKSSAPSRSMPTSGPEPSRSPKGLWRKSTYNGSTSNALVPDYADRSRRRRLLQRRPRRGRVARANTESGFSGSTSGSDSGSSRSGFTASSIGRTAGFESASGPIRSPEHRIRETRTGTRNPEPGTCLSN